MASYKLDKGFLFSYGWEDAMRHLKPKEFYNVFWALYNYQKSEGKEPLRQEDYNTPEALIISVLKTHIDNRLEGSENGKKSASLRRLKNDFESEQ